MAVQEQNYWPGFVDALSNVVLTLVFVLVVFVTALLIMSNKVESKAQQMIQEIKEQHKNIVPTAELEERLQKALQQIEVLQEKVSASQDMDYEQKLLASRENKPLTSKFINVQKFKDKITLDYPHNSVAIDGDILKDFNKLLESVRYRMEGHKIVVHSYLGPELYTAARRLAYYRILNVRNYLLHLKLGTSETIKTKIIEGQERTLGRVEIIFE